MGRSALKQDWWRKGFQDPDLKEGVEDASGRVSFRSSHLQVISPSAIRTWKLWNLESKHAFLQENGFCRDVFSQAPGYWDPYCKTRVWKLKAPAFGLNNAPAASY